MKPVSALLPFLDSVRVWRVTGHSHQEIADLVAAQGGPRVSAVSVFKFCRRHGFAPEDHERLYWRLGLNRHKIALALFRGFPLNRIASQMDVSERRLAQYIRTTKLTDADRRKRRSRAWRPVWMESLREDILKAHAEGLTVRQITIKIFGNDHGANRQSVADFLKKNLTAPAAGANLPPQ